MLSNQKELLLSENDAAEMRHHYEQEYIQLTKRLEHVKSILGKFESSVVNITNATNQPIDPESISPRALMKLKAKEHEKAIEDEEPGAKRKRKKKRGPKSIWGNFILRRIRQADRPVSYSEMVRDAMVIHSIPQSKLKNAKASILNSAFRLRAIHGKVETIGIEGKKEKYLVLAKWVGQNGELVAPYKARFDEMVKAKK
ncbi:MAG: hypothetical protein P8L71_11735 [Flavobacteriales bacterium]|nr:hypothetical protein [Flavobacteriales bacterium]